MVNDLTDMEGPNVRLNEVEKATEFPENLGFSGSSYFGSGDKGVAKTRGLFKVYLRNS